MMWKRQLIPGPFYGKILLEMAFGCAKGAGSPCGVPSNHISGTVDDASSRHRCPGSPPDSAAIGQQMGSKQLLAEPSWCPGRTQGIDRAVPSTKPFSCETRHQGMGRRQCMKNADSVKNHMGLQVRANFGWTVQNQSPSTCVHLLGGTNDSWLIQQSQISPWPPPSFGSATVQALIDGFFPSLLVSRWTFCCQIRSESEVLL